VGPIDPPERVTYGYGSMNQGRKAADTPNTVICRKWLCPTASSLWQPADWRKACVFWRTAITGNKIL